MATRLALRFGRRRTVLLSGGVAVAGLLLTLLPVVAVFVVWDLYAIAAGHWTFDSHQTLGVELPGGLPLDELLFFVVVPICSVLAYEAVRVVRSWPGGDE